MEILKLSTKYKVRRLDKQDVDIIYDVSYPNAIFINIIHLLLQEKVY